LKGRRKWKEEEEDEEGEKENSPRGHKERKEISNTTQHTYIHTYIE
jgi:hypothetical protein